MSDLRTFIFENQDVRVAGTAKAPEWVAQDVCDILSIAEARSSLRDFDEDEKGVCTMHTPGGVQELLTVTEFGLYRLIFKSRKEVAKKFQRWVLHEVLPAIRKTGSYTDVNHQLQQAVKVCSEEFSNIIQSSPLEAQALVQVFASQSGLQLGQQSLLSQEQLSEQSLAMHRVALSFNKHINADKFAEKVSSPDAIAKLRTEMVTTAKENIELHRKLLELQVLMMDTVPRQIVDRLRADYELTIDSMNEQIEMLQTMAKSANERASQYQAMTNMKALPPGRTPTGRISKRRSY